MKRHRLLVLSTLVSCWLITGAAIAASPSVPTLTIINWEEWVSPKVVQTFERREKVKVNVLTFSSVEESLALLAANDGKADILVGSTVLLDQLKAKQQLQKLNRSKLGNVKHIMPRFSADPDYAVPYLWGYTGIAVRKDLVKTPITTYAQLLALAKQQPGKVSLMTDPVEFAYGVLWGLSPKNANPESIPQLQSALALYNKEYADKVRLSDVDYEPGNPIASGKIIAAQVYSDYASFLATDQNVPLAYVNPTDICILWMDNMMLLAKAPQPELAHRFMNYVTEAKVAANNAMEVKSTSANPLAMQFYSKEYLNNPVIKPTFDGTERCRIYKSHTPATQKFYDALNPTGIQ
jgi:spermidine/putrescine transport system substrate-binding protein